MKELTQITKAIQDEGIEFALCGGMAMAVYSFPRATLDIDLMLEERDFQRVKNIVAEFGFDIDAGVMECSGGSVSIHRLNKIVSGSGETMSLDMLLITPEVRAAWEGRVLLAWRYGEIPVVSPEGLIHLKSLRMSGQDQDDIQKLKRIIDEDQD